MQGPKRARDKILKYQYAKHKARLGRLSFKYDPWGSLREIVNHAASKVTLKKSIAACVVSMGILGYVAYDNLDLRSSPSSSSQPPTVVLAGYAANPAHASTGQSRIALGDRAADLSAGSGKVYSPRQQAEQFISTGGLEDFLSGWEAAWESGPEYVTEFYSPMFKSEKGEDKPAYLRRKAQYWDERKGTIDVRVYDKSQEITGDGSIIVRFSQDYCSCCYNDTGRKELSLSYDNSKDRWQVAGERFFFQGKLSGCR